MASYERWLGKPEVAILHMLGLFDRPVDEDEMAALGAEPVVPGLTDALVGIGRRKWNRALVKLRHAGLLAAEQNKRLDAHPLVREHFGEQLKREQSKAWREGHRRLYDHLRKNAKELPETVEEMAPLYAAVIHGCLAGKSQDALDDVYKRRIQRGDVGFSTYKLGGYSAELAALSVLFDPAWERLAPGLTEQTQAYVLNEAAIDLNAMGRPTDAVMLLGVDLPLTSLPGAFADRRDFVTPLAG